MTLKETQLYFPAEEPSFLDLFLWVLWAYLLHILEDTNTLLLSNTNSKKPADTAQSLLQRLPHC